MRIMKIAAISLILGFCLSIGHVDAQNISDDARRYFDRGQAAVEMAKTSADYEDAIKEFEKAARLAPDWSDVYYNLGLIQEKIGKYDDAFRNLTKYLELSPNASDAGEVKKFIAKIEYKMEKEEGIKRVYRVMTSGVYSDAHQFSEALWGDYERKTISGDHEHKMLEIFRMVSG